LNTTAETTAHDGIPMAVSKQVRVFIHGAKKQQSVTMRQINYN